MDARVASKLNVSDQNRARPRLATYSDEVAVALPREPACVFRLAGGDARIVNVNAALARRLDLDVDTARGRSVREILPAEAALAVMRAVRRALDGRRAIKFMLPSAWNGEGMRLIRVNMKRVGDDMVLATLPESAVFGRRQSDRQVLEALGTVDGGVIYVLDMRSRSVMYVTERIEQLTGLSCEAFEGYAVQPGALHSEFVQSLFHTDDRAAVIEHVSDLVDARDDTVVTLLCRVRHSSAGWRWVEARSRVLSRTGRGVVERVIGIAVDVTEQRQLSADLRATSFALLRAEENERRRIARDIHDSTAQHIVALDLGLGRLENMAPPGLPGVQEWIEEMRSLTKTAHQELRVATFALHPPELEHTGLADTLRDLIRGFGRRTGLSAEFHIEGTPRTVSPPAEHALLRVSQEALLNIHKHARAKVAKLRLRYEDAAIFLEIEDDGIGADAAQNKLWEAAGVGLQSMKARLTALDGVLSIVSGRNGFMVRAHVRLVD